MNGTRTSAALAVLLLTGCSVSTDQVTLSDDVIAQAPVDVSPDNLTDVLERALQDIAALDAARVNDATRIAALEDALGAANAELAALRADVDAASADVADLGADVAAVAASAVVVLDSDLAIAVPGGDCAALQSELAALDFVRLGTGVTATLNLGDGVYACSSPLTLSHPDGERIAIVGDTTDPSAVELRFADSAGIELVGPFVLGLLDGVTIAMDANTTTDDLHGVQAVDGALIRLGESVVVSGWSGDGVRADYGGIVRANGVTVSGTGEGFAAVRLGLVVAGDALATNNINGFFSSRFGLLDAEGATSMTNTSYGFRARRHGWLVATSGLADSNGSTAYSAIDGALIVANGANATGNHPASFDPAAAGVDGTISE